MSRGPHHDASRTRIIAGCMTGTSLDGIDVAVLKVTGTGLAMQCQLLSSVSVPLDDHREKLYRPLRRLCDGHPLPTNVVAEVSRRLSLLHVTALREAIQRADATPDFIVMHGQTVYHRPPLSWQLCSPAIVAHQLGLPVLSDLRAADLAAGGQGAPITPLADWILYRKFASQSADRSASDARTAIVNLGGFANYTLLPTGTDDANLSLIAAGDICACNQVLDAVAAVAINEPFDKDGHAALEGTVQPALLRKLEALFERQSLAGRSLGTGDEMRRWIKQSAKSVKDSGTGADLCATACAAIGGTIGRTLSRAAGEGTLKHIIVFGGGARNKALMLEIERAAEVPALPGQAFGMAVEVREAACMAVLGALSHDGVPITLPQVTKLPPGTPAPIAGSWCGVKNLNC